MSTVKYVARLVITLFLITAVVATLLGGVNAITKDRIAAVNAEKTARAISLVVPGEGTPEQVKYEDQTGTVTGVWAKPEGYAVQVEPSGFGGTVTMMVGLSKEGKVLGVQIISHTETPGLGANAAAENAAGKEFRDSFIGLSGNITVSKDGGQADTLTGATITSRAVAAGVTAAAACRIVSEEGTK